MFTMPFRKQARAQGAFLNATQQPLIKEKFEILRQASFGFTQDRLLPIQEEDRSRTFEQLSRPLGGKVDIAGGGSSPSA